MHAVTGRQLLFIGGSLDLSARQFICSTASSAMQAQCVCHFLPYPEKFNSLLIRGCGAMHVLRRFCENIHWKFTSLRAQEISRRINEWMLEIPLEKKSTGLSPAASAGLGRHTRSPWSHSEVDICGPYSRVTNINLWARFSSDTRWIPIAPNWM